MALGATVRRQWLAFVGLSGVVERAGLARGRVGGGAVVVAGAVGVAGGATEREAERQTDTDTDRDRDTGARQRPRHCGCWPLIDGTTELLEMGVER